MSIKIILVLLALLVPTTARVEPQPQPQPESRVLYFDLSTQCASMQQLQNLLEEDYGELPVAIGMGIVRSSTTLQTHEGMMLVYVNPKKFTYTVVIHFTQDKVGCVLISGSQFQPAPLGPRT